MTPQMQLAFRLLRLSAGELHARVQDALESNVMLESDAELDATWVLESAPGTAPTAGAQPGDSGGTLHEHLAWQLEQAPLPNGPRAIGRALIQAIDGDGYLKESTGAVAERVAGEVRTDAGVVESVLAILQRFDPAGVGARSAAECISLQLAQLDGDTPGLETAQQIACHYLDLASKQRLRDLRRLTGSDTDALDTALALVRNCDLQPGAAFRSPRAAYGSPDVFARQASACWGAELNPAAFPGVRLNERYAATLTRADSQAEMRVQLLLARWLVRGLEIRDAMLLGIARAIVARNAGFLGGGDEFVRPIPLGDLATSVGMHSSTVARVTCGKYLHTPRGVFELRFFCANPVAAAVSFESTGAWLLRTRPAPAAG